MVFAVVGEEEEEEVEEVEEEGEVVARMSLILELDMAILWK